MMMNHRSLVLKNTEIIILLEKLAEEREMAIQIVNNFADVLLANIN